MALNKKINFPIDFVVTWVDDTDVNWQKQKYVFRKEEHDDKSETRFRDTGLFKYWFRAVEEYTPWVNHIYLVTNGQVPKFLDLSNQKITLIKHEDIMPKKALPTFNSNAIEFSLNNIPGLSEHFVVFNDDMFVNRKLEPVDFFSSEGLPKDTAGLNQIMPIENFDHITANNIAIINQQFIKKEVMRENWSMFLNIKNGPLNIYTILLWFFPRFSRIYDLHIPYSFNKSFFNSFIEKNDASVKKTIHTKFRDITDISLWGVRYYQIVTGNISPRRYNFGKFYTLEDEEKIINDLQTSKHGLIDINDTTIENYGKILDNINVAFNNKLPHKSVYELKNN